MRRDIHHQARLSIAPRIAILALLLAAPLGATDPVGAPDPAVAFLTLSAPVDTLEVGQEAQLSVIATLADATTADLTADPLTSYQVIPQGAATVDADGLLRATAPANAVIVVSYGHVSSNASAELPIAIREANDRDGDGLPDFWEIDNGFDPDSAADGGLDVDTDGLDNRREFELGTNPRLADTDGDFLPDPVEVDQGTDPLVPEPISGTSNLDENCVISALNRSAPVEPDGTWVLPNVPANVGRVRLRATCVEDGITRSGQSEFLTVPPDGILRVAEIVFDPAQRTLRRLTLSAPLAELDTPGQTVALTAVATFPDGSTDDVTAGAAGTDWTSSNPSIAAVDANGVVSAVSSGTALISAVHDGALGALTLRVRLGGDGDGDGLPDDFELQNGLDPNDPADAFSDPDEDGLTVIDEFERGLDPFAPDSDADGLVDGEEVRDRGTDPLLFDSDGDQVSDGLEAQVGSDPLDPLSVDLTGILNTLEVEPSGGFTLVFDTALGESSRQITVRGTLIDASVIDITDSLYGTTYESSELTVVSFGLDPGRLFAGLDGLALITVRNQSLVETLDVTVETFAPRALSFLPLPGYANKLDLRGDHVFVASGQAGLVTVDVSDLGAPAIAATLSLGKSAYSIAVDGPGGTGTRAYVGAEDELVVIDVADPTAPFEISRIVVPGKATDVAVKDGTAAVAAGRGGVVFYDVTDPALPLLIDNLLSDRFARGVALGDGVAVVAASRSGVFIIDLADPAAPGLLGTTHSRPGRRSNAAAVALRGRRAWIANGSDRSLGGLAAIDFSRLDTPFVDGASPDAFGLVGVDLDGQLALTADFFFVNAVPIFNVEADPPAFQAVLDFSGAPSFRDDNGTDIAVRNGVAFLTAGRGIAINRAVGNSGLHIGQYRSLQDTVGLAPSAAIVAPLAGAEIRERRPLTMRVDAEDDFRVAAVSFLIDGQVSHTDFEKPFEFTFDAPEAAGITLGAVATDLAGNQGVAEPLVLTITPDDTPFAEILTPGDGDTVFEGESVPLRIGASDDVAVGRVEILVDGVLQAARTSPPYGFDFSVPLGISSFTVTARVEDDVFQESFAAPVTVNVDPDPPPAVHLVEPVDGASVIESSFLRIVAGATDNFPLDSMTLVVDGVDGPIDTAEPWEFLLQVPVGATLHLAARGSDSLGQEATSTEFELTIVADPGTTVSGRVVNENGATVADAAVNCAGIAGTSAADGSFIVAGVPTTSALVSCAASANGTSGRSAAVAPEPGATTLVGDVELLGQVLYLGSGDPFGFYSSLGALFLHDPFLDRLHPWSFSPFLAPDGFSGLAFDDLGILYASTLRGDFVFESAGGAKGPGSGLSSELLVFDPATGEVSDFLGAVFEVQPGGGLGPIVPSKADAPEGDFPTADVPLIDLTFEPETDELYGLGIADAVAGRIYRVDRQDAEATLLAQTRIYSSAGLAAGGDGLLYLLGEDGQLFLEVYDPLSGALVRQADLGPTGTDIRGMTLRPGGGGFAVASGNELLLFDPDAGTLLPDVSPSSELSGDELMGLAFRPITEPPVLTSLTGTVLDLYGDPVQGAEVFYLGVSAFTDENGEFTITNVLVSTGGARVEVIDPNEARAVSESRTPVEGGVTDFGEIQVESGGAA